MAGALEGRVAADSTAAPRALATRAPAPPALLAGAALVVGGSLLRGGGAEPSPLFWIGSAAVLIAAAATTAVLAGALPRPALGAAGATLAGLAAALAAWSGVTVIWSIGPDLSWDSLNRAAAYAAVLCLGILVGAVVPGGAKAAAVLLAALFAVTIAWALATAVVPAIGPDVTRSARLRDPVEYWNALALVAAMALPLWLWLQRPFAAVAVFCTVVALLLTTSRGGFLVAVLAVALWLAAVRPRREPAWLLLVSVPPGLAVGGWALTTPVAEAGSSGDTRSGILLGVVLVAVAAAVFVLARRPTPSRASRAAGWLAVAGFLAAVGIAIPHLSGAWNEFRNPPAVQVTNDPSRLETLSSNHRWTWWTQAWSIFRAHPLGGTGAGTYELARRPIRKDTLAPIDPHDLGLKALSDTGIVGFLLVLGAVAAGAAAAVGAVRRTTGAERGAAAALAAGGTAWLAQSLIDMPWEFAAATVPMLFGLGVLATTGRRAGDRAGGTPLALAAPAAVALALVASFAFPWLAQRRLDTSLDALTRGNFAGAAADARDARTLDPLAVEPLHLEGTAYELSGRIAAARRAYQDAVRLQPENPDTWWELGRFEYDRCNLAHALVYADRAWGLDALNPDTGRLLNEVRAASAKGSCRG